MRPSSRWITLALSASYALGSEATAHTRHDVNLHRLLHIDSDLRLRQEMPSIDWWPYPPQGAAQTEVATSAGQVIAAAQTGTLQHEQTTQSEVQPTSIPGSTSGTTSSALTTSSTSSASSSSSSSSSNSTPATSTSSSSSSSSVISLTASSSVPENAATHVTSPKSQPVSAKTMMYLIPVFVLAGVILGGVTAWFAYGCLTRKPRESKRRKGDRLMAGVPYEYHEAKEGYDAHGDDYYASEKHRREAPEAPTPGYEVNGVEEDVTDSFVNSGNYHQPHPRRPAIQPRSTSISSRSNDAATIRERSSSGKYPQANSRSNSAIRPNASSNTKDDMGWGALDYDHDHERNTRLAPPEPHRKLTRNGTARTAKTTRTTATSTSFYSQLDNDCDDLDDERTEYDYGDMYDYYNRSRQDWRNDRGTAGPARKHSTANDQQSVFSRTTATPLPSQATGGAASMGGFRMIEGSPLPTPALSVLSNWTGFTAPLNILRSNGSGNEDRYTPVPSRSGSRSRDGSEEGRSRSESPVKRGGATPRREEGRVRRDSHPLPQSPPQILSPRMDEEIFFSSRLGS